MREIDDLVRGPRPRAEEIRDAVCSQFGYLASEIMNQGDERTGNHAERREVRWCRSMISFIGLQVGYSTQEIATKCLGGKVELVAMKLMAESIKADTDLRRAFSLAVKDIRAAVDARMAVAV